MKYIRTKEGKLCEKIKEATPFTIRAKWCKNAIIVIEKTNIVKQADTIKELCDEFVVIVEGEHYIRVPAGNPNFQTYGAIWTGKGLIYVAKMNDKGELELL